MRKKDHMMVHNPYSDEYGRAEDSPLEWDTSCPIISDADLGSDFKMERRLRMLEEPEPMLNGAFTTETADHRQWSYWPSEPPILASPGYKWFDYGPLARGMHLWGQVPVGTVPSYEEQRVQLETHYMKSFSGFKIPARLNFWLKKHGLKPVYPVPPWVIAGLSFAGLTVVVSTVFKWLSRK